MIPAYYFKNDFCPVFLFSLHLGILKLFSSIFRFKMPSGESVPPKVVKAIFYLRVEGKRWKDIGMVFKEKEDWAWWIAKRYRKDTGLSLKGREQSGWRWKFGCNLDKTIDLFAYTFWSSTSKDISAALKEIITAHLSSRTIRRYLKKVG